MADVSDAFPASPTAHYRYAFSGNPDTTPPVELDPSEADRWYFHRMTYTDAVDPTSIRLPDGSSKFAATGPARSIMLYSYHPDPTQVAAGTPREAYAARIVSTRPDAALRQDDDVLSSGNRRVARNSSMMSRKDGLRANQAGSTCHI